MTADISSSPFPCLVSPIQYAEHFGKCHCCRSHTSIKENMFQIKVFDNVSAAEFLQ